MSERALRSKGSPPPELPLPETRRRQASQTPSSTQTPTPPVSSASAAPQQPSTSEPSRSATPEPIEPSSAPSPEPSRSTTPTQSIVAVEAIVAAMSQPGSHAPTPPKTCSLTVSGISFPPSRECFRMKTPLVSTLPLLLCLRLPSLIILNTKLEKSIPAEPFCMPVPDKPSPVRLPPFAFFLVLQLTPDSLRIHGTQNCICLHPFHRLLPIPVASCNL